LQSAELAFSDSNAVPSASIVTSGNHQQKSLATFTTPDWAENKTGAPYSCIVLFEKLETELRNKTSQQVGVVSA